MNKDIAVLNEIYKNAQLGEESLSQLAPKIRDPLMKSGISHQIGQYREFKNKARTMMKDYSVYPKGKTLLETLPQRAGITMDTLVDSSGSHIAEMIINGNTMGIIEMTKTMNDTPPSNPGVTRLGEQIVEFERHSINQMKQFL